MQRTEEQQERKKDDDAHKKTRLITTQSLNSNTDETIGDSHLTMTENT